MLFDAISSWVHDEFSIKTYPFDHNLCGNLSYKATFMGVNIDLTTDPVIYDSSKWTFTIYSEDGSLRAVHPYTVETHLVDYP